MVDITPDIYRLYTTTPDPNMFLLLREILGVFSCSPISSLIRNGTIFTFVWSVSHLYFFIWDWIFFFLMVVLHQALECIGRKGREFTEKYGKMPLLIQLRTYNSFKIWVDIPINNCPPQKFSAGCLIKTIIELCCLEMSQLRIILKDQTLLKMFETIKLQVCFHISYVTLKPVC